MSILDFYKNEITSILFGDNMENKNKNRWWKPLLAIPIVLVVDAVLLLIAMYLDTKIFTGGELGHGFPAVSLLMFIVLAAITIIVVIDALRG